MATPILTQRHLRRIDADATFQVKQFGPECLLNACPICFIPCFFRRGGWAGLVNRSFAPWQGLAYQQVLLSLAAIALLILPFYARGIVAVEVVSPLALYLLRSVTLGIKYGFYSPSAYAELDDGVLDRRFVIDMLILGGWNNPSAAILFQEFNQAIVRRAPTSEERLILFLNEYQRTRVLKVVKDSIPAYLEYERELLSSDLISLLEQYCDESDRGNRIIHAPHTRSRPPDGRGREHRFHHGSVIVVPRVGAESRSIFYAECGTRTLPALPFKLLLWHVIHRSFVTSLVSSSMGVITITLTLVYCLLPFVVRIIFNTSVFGSTWVDQVLLVLILYVTLSNLPFNFLYLVAGASELKRRESAAADLAHIIDPFDAAAQERGEGEDEGESGDTEVVEEARGEGSGGGRGFEGVSPMFLSRTISGKQREVVRSRRIPQKVLQKRAEEQSQRLRIPLTLAPNLGAWVDGVRVARDVGAGFDRRVQAYTSVFAIATLILIVYLILLSFVSTTNILESFSSTIILLQGVTLNIAFTGAFVAQILFASGLNGTNVRLRARLSKLEEVLIEREEELIRLGAEESTLSEIQRAQRMCDLAQRSVTSEIDHRPARVAGVPASMGVLTTFLSLSASGVAAVLQAIFR